MRSTSARSAPSISALQTRWRATWCTTATRHTVAPLQFSTTHTATTPAGTPCCHYYFRRWRHRCRRQTTFGWWSGRRRRWGYGCRMIRKQKDSLNVTVTVCRYHFRRWRHLRLQQSTSGCRRSRRLVRRKSHKCCEALKSKVGVKDKEKVIVPAGDRCVWMTNSQRTKSSTLVLVAVRQRRRLRTAVVQLLYLDHHRRWTGRPLPIWNAPKQLQPKGHQTENGERRLPRQRTRRIPEVDTWRHREVLGRCWTGVTSARTAGSATRDGTDSRSTCERIPATSRCSAPSAGVRSVIQATSTSTCGCTPATPIRPTGVATAARCSSDAETSSDISGRGIPTPPTRYLHSKKYRLTNPISNTRILSGNEFHIIGLVTEDWTIKYRTPVTRHKQLVTTGRPQMLPTGNVITHFQIIKISVLYKTYKVIQFGHFIPNSIQTLSCLFTMDLPLNFLVHRGYVLTLRILKKARHVFIFSFYLLSSSCRTLMIVPLYMDDASNLKDIAKNTNKIYLRW